MGLSGGAAGGPHPCRERGWRSGRDLSLAVRGGLTQPDPLLRPNVCWAPGCRAVGRGWKWGVLCFQTQLPSAEGLQGSELAPLIFHGRTERPREGNPPSQSHTASSALTPARSRPTSLLRSRTHALRLLCTLEAQRDASPRGGKPRGRLQAGPPPPRRPPARAPPALRGCGRAQAAAEAPPPRKGKSERGRHRGARPGRTSSCGRG